MGRSLGQRETKIQPIQDLEQRRIVFSKCKRGLFKKAAELSILCGADTAIVVFSPQGNIVHSFGSPSVESIINRFLSQDPRVNPQYLPHEASRHGATMAALRWELHGVENQLKAEKVLDVAHKKSDDYINGLSRDELLQLKGKLEALKRDVEARSKELQKEAVAASSSSSSSMSDANGPPTEETDDETDIYHSP
ncbi:agamous-like MADS-box protein AGL29 [Vitis riparia]|uniref:agamous-like MADS-box protein AGL29 n=1 Tax=Vitis riparia TaxID=96939 RepID=UPI00155A3248|nr:agamous-like MADS-box protein AGL29 [Vitis riparia]